MTKEQAINTAAKWWADKLKSRAPHNNGDNSTSSMMACAFADMAMKDVSDDQYVIFENALKKVLVEELDGTYRFTRLSIGTDYNPCTLLQDAADEADISYSNFPYKVGMLIIRETNGDGTYDFHVDVSDGYAQPWVGLNPVE